MWVQWSERNSDLHHKHGAVKVSVLLLMGSSDQEYVIMAQSTAGKHLLVQIADFQILFTELWLM